MSCMKVSTEAWRVPPNKSSQDLSPGLLKASGDEQTSLVAEHGVAPVCSSQTSRGSAETGLQSSNTKSSLAAESPGKYPRYRRIWLKRRGPLPRWSCGVMSASTWRVPFALKVMGVVPQSSADWHSSEGLPTLAATCCQKSFAAAGISRAELLSRSNSLAVQPTGAEMLLSPHEGAAVFAEVAPLTTVSKIRICPDFSPSASSRALSVRKRQSSQSTTATSSPCSNPPSTTTPFNQPWTKSCLTFTPEGRNGRPPASRLGGCSVVHCTRSGRFSSCPIQSGPATQVRSGVLPHLTERGRAPLLCNDCPATEWRP
mmetsp:Transcript_111099/g.254734  ORF Transcript_111099/g.254734 Transcript_111099/m.254734 type:complete len:314 (-) Transcript_111099:992-1933(-)